MNRRLVAYIALALIFCSISGLHGQSDAKSKIECTARILTHDAAHKADVQMLIGNVEFSHEGAVCYCDTAYFNEKSNTVDAYGENLVVHLNDSVMLYGNHILYDGNSKIAIITKDTVVLTDETTTLYTDRLVYDRNTERAYYNTYGRVVSGNSTLISRQGWYYTVSNDVYFKDSVVLVTPQYKVESDTLRYNTLTEIAYFLGPTVISSDDNYMTCNYGWYNTYSNVCQFEDSARMYNNTQCLSADTIWYDLEHDLGVARSNVYIYDSTQNVYFTSNYAEYQKEKGYAYLIDSAVAVIIENEDSLFMHGEQMWASFDSAQELEYMYTYYNVRFYRNDIQGACDSLSYNAIDSIILMIGSPVLWTGENQLLSDTVKLLLKNGQISQMQFINNAFIAADVFKELKFNQIKGANMLVDFENNNISTVFIDANAECLYYVQEDDKSLIGVQKSASASMRIFFEDNEVSKIRFYHQVKGEMYPEDKLPADKLNNFKWLNIYRPIDRFDIFRAEAYNAAIEN